MGTKNYPILGIGKRPKGAKDTGCFLTKKNEISKDTIYNLDGTVAYNLSHDKS